jgi:hypothetical protein
MPYTIPKLTIFAPLALLAGDGVERHAVDLRRDRGVDVLPVHERLGQVRVLRQVRQQAQLDLAVVRGDQHAALRRDERAADLAPDVGPDRDVLQVGVGRRQPARRRDGLVEARVDPPRLLVDLLLERDEVGAHELGELAVLEDELRDDAPPTRPR